SPGTKLVQPQRTGSQDSTADGIRKRVGKACDRCRMKKSRCDGSQPCLRCKADNTICVFGERKRSHDKVYPKGYVEMLEQQQSQLVSGLQELYKRLRDVEQWDGAVLTEVEGRPLTHDILASLRLLETKHDGDIEAFEENVEKLQARLLASGAGFTRRRGSISSESEQSQHGHARSASRDAPTASKPARSTTTPSVFGSSSMAGPAPVQVQAQPQRPTLLASNDSQMSQFSQISQMSPLSGDPQFYEAEWAFP
ncbi:uncharacterized protein K489DRAFT_307876, partial [Dissoconium aciculare CBS 342.82]|uniref:Zn(2)-C6 fungal-type domain-containing protein n=1 Tax=Dissoconium aciculare CBS 342.82 TaxID=1314786 RepID=A0A6J3MB70_9PEZI